MNRRAIVLAVVCVCLLVIRGSIAQESKSVGTSENSNKLHREGMRFEQQAVSFRTENDRLLLVVQIEAKPIVVLENLASQRIYRATREDPNDCRWTVTGSFTEFEGKNYFLVERAIRVYQKDK